MFTMRTMATLVRYANKRAQAYFERLSLFPPVKTVLELRT